MQKIILSLIIITLFSCTKSNITIIEKKEELKAELALNYKLMFPVNMKNYYDANPFGNITSNGKHLGADLNKKGNPYSDYRDTIYSIGCGEVVEAYDAFVAIKHKLKDSKYILSSYFHCDTILISWGSIVKKGQPIALIGKKYTKSPHLHFEILTDTNKRAGFYGDVTWCVNPIKFINAYNK
jgi:murein DD-endopeptidase MepM/ murein hydrolase activator NlpD